MIAALTLPLQRFFALTLSLCVIMSAPALGARLTLTDIVEGIQARRSKIRDITLQYLLTHENQDRFYQKYGKATVTDLESHDVTPIPAGKYRERIHSMAYRVLEKGNKAAYEIYDVDMSSNARTVAQKSVFDGEIQKYVNIKKLNGSVARRDPALFIRFMTVTSMLRLEYRDLLDYIKLPDVRWRILDERILNGDLLVDISITRTKDPLIPDKSGTATRPLESITEHLITLVANKDFWPLKIEKYLQMNNLRTGDSIRALAQRTQVGGFVQADGLYYPASVRQDDFDNDLSWPPDSPLAIISDSILMTSATAVIEDVKVNSGLSDQDFDLEFPLGTRYHDAIIGMTFVVGEDPDKLAQRMVESADTLPVDQFTKEEAMAILEKRRQGKWEEADRLVRNVLAGKKTQKADTITPPAPQPSPSEDRSVTVLPVMQERIAVRTPWYHRVGALLLVGLCAGIGYLGTRFIVRTRVRQRDG